MCSQPRQMASLNTKSSSHKKKPTTDLAKRGRKVVALSVAERKRRQTEYVKKHDAALDCIRLTKDTNVHLQAMRGLQ